MWRYRLVVFPGQEEQRLVATFGDTLGVTAPAVMSVRPVGEVMGDDDEAIADTEVDIVFDP